MEKSENALFVAIILVLSISTSNLAIAQSHNESSAPTLSPISIKTDFPSYLQADTIIVTGHVSEVQNGTAILLRVLNPANLLISTMTLSPSSDGNFNMTFRAVGPVWNKSGNYTIVAQYGKYIQTNSTFYYGVGNSPPLQGPLINLYDKPPLKQIESGISPKDVNCKQGFVLILKIYSDSPACVKPLTQIILEQRGWTLPITQPNKDIIYCQKNPSNACNHTMELWYNDCGGYPNQNVTSCHDGRIEAYLKANGLSDIMTNHP